MLPISALIQDRWWWCPMCGPAGAWGWAMMIFMTLFWIAVIALVVWLVWRFAFSGGAPAPRGEDRAEEILRERFARGEIDSETFERMLEDLRRKS